LPEPMIYADHSATAPLSRAALEAMMPYLSGEFGNPSSAYAPGRRAKRALEQARAAVAEAFGVSPREIYFTSGGTEADNWALRFAARRARTGETAVVTDAAEHHAVLRTAEQLAKEGARVKILGVDSECRVSPDSLRAALSEPAAMVSVMAANNETGTLMPIAELSACAHAAGALFHTDAVQAAGHIPLNGKKLGIDLMSFSAHKFGGPKGVGGLFVRSGLEPEPLIFGGGQERGLRSGTENVAGAVGMAAALAEACREMEKNARRLASLRDELIRGVLAIPGSHLTGSPANRLPGHASFVFERTEGEALLFLLDQRGICVSSGSACSAGSAEPSHVLLAMGIPPELARCALRVTFGPENTPGEVGRILAVLPELISRVRGAYPSAGA
jgi:cysteine desulfurase